MSIRLRLGLWYGTLTGLAILVVSLLTYAAHTRGHYDDLDHALYGAVQHVAGEAAAAPHVSAGVPDPVMALLATPASPDVGLRIYGPGGEVLAASEESTFAPPLDPRELASGSSRPAYDRLAGLAPPMTTVHIGPGIFSVAWGADGERWRVLAMPLASGGRSVVALAPLARLDASVNRLRWLVASSGVGGALLTMATGWLLARGALRPVAALTATASAIAHSRSFSLRVPAAAARQDELGRLAATFNEMLGSLERAYAAEQRFVSDASHELRAPLTVIQANLDLLERQQTLTPEVDADTREAVTEAAREARRMGALVAELLALARADAGVPLRREHVELDRVLLDAFREARHLTAGQQLDLGDLQPAVVEGDAERLRQLLLILLDNALRYTPAGGTVQVSLTCHAGGASAAGVRLSGPPPNGLPLNGVHRTGAQTQGAAARSAPGGLAEVSIRDSGIGIGSEHLPHVFERFYRADPARTRDPGGSGLGLSIAQWIARHHGGDVLLASTPGEGTTATVLLPLAGRVVSPQPLPANR